MKVTSNEPESEAVVCSTEVGATRAPPTVVWNGTQNLSPSNRTPCVRTSCRPCCTGAVTRSEAPPLAVLKAHLPEPVNVFGLAPTVSRMYGAPIGSEPPNSW